MDVNVDKLKSELFFELTEKNTSAEEYLKLNQILLSTVTSIRVHEFLRLILKICQTTALIVNQMNKYELIMLSRMEAQFKIYLS